MKRNSESHPQLAKKVCKESHHVLLLDLNYSSNLLSTKIADIPHKLKYETILAPIFEYCFGTSDQHQVWKPLTKNKKTWYENGEYICKYDDEIMKLKIDWIRDETFIYSQLLFLIAQKLDIIASKFGLWNNRKFILNSCCAITNALRHANEELRNDREFVIEILNASVQNIPYISDELRNDKEIVKQAVKIDGNALQYAPKELQDDEELVLLALESYDSALQLASDRLKNDRDLWAKALSRGIRLSALLDFPSSLSENIDDRELLVMNSKIDGFFTLELACSELRNDKELVMQAIQDNPKAFGFASYELRNDRELVKEIVMLNGEFLIYASEELRDDKELVKLALKTHPDAIHRISDRLRKDTEFISKLIRKRGFEELPKEFSNYRQIALRSIKLNQYNMNRISDELKNDREFILQAVKRNGEAIKHVNDEFKSDREIVMAAVSQNGYALAYVPDKYFKDQKIVIKAAQNISETSYAIFPNFFKKWPGRWKRDKELFMKLGAFFYHFPRYHKFDREIVMECLKTHPESVLWNAYPLIVTDRVLLMRIMKQDGLLLGKLPFKYRNDRELVSFAIQQNKEAFKFVSDELKNDLQIYLQTRSIK